MAIGDEFQFDKINYKVIKENECQVGYGYESSPYTSAVDAKYTDNVTIPRIAMIGTNKYTVFSCFFSAQ